MAKILLVEDDNNLREIYEARLQAEGYDIVAARDGEEALVVAKKELPDLVISDVMMPKISGFEMLDILRNTDGLKDVKVIMLTALGQAEDQTRANSLGADRYLVKSQVTLEDIVNAAHDLLNPGEAAAAAAAPEPAVVPTPPEPVATPAPAEPTAASDPAPVIPLAAAPPEEPAVPDVAPQMPPTPASTVPDVPGGVNDPTAPAEEEPAPAASVEQNDSADSLTAPQEQAAVTEQINNFVESQSGSAPAAVEPALNAEPAPAPEVTTPETPAEPAVPAESEPVTTTPEQEQALNDAMNSLTPSAEASAETPAPEEDAASKKVIAPLSPEAPRKSLEELLAAETAKAEAPKLNSTQAPNPGTPPASPTTQNGDFDPNSIAL